MKLQSKLDKVELNLEAAINDSFLFCGSCFAENIGEEFLKAKLNASVNPLGIAYNPVSLFHLLKKAIRSDFFQSSDFDFYHELHYSFDLHSSFSGTKLDQVVQDANKAIDETGQWLKKTNYLFISLGTSWVYRKKGHGTVNNCHKVAVEHFQKVLLDQAEIFLSWTQLYDEIQKLNPELKVIFTVSPVRHLKDGFHENQLSKSTLLLVVDKICRQFENCHYFSSYEIMMDELRDYRFYQEDLVHPNRTAIQIIFEYFLNAFFKSDSRENFRRIQKAISSLHHKAFYPEREIHQKFLTKLIAEFQELAKSLKLDFSEEIDSLKDQLIKP